MTTQEIVLITGANKGIGFATAREFGAAGHTVLLGAREAQLGRAAAQEPSGGLDVRFVRLDVTDQDTVDAAAETIAAEYGRLDILINNAGISRDRDYRAALTTMPVAPLREAYEVNVFGVVAVTNAMLPLLRKSAAGYIGNVSSGLGTVAFLADPEETVARVREPALLQLVQGRAERGHPDLRQRVAGQRDQGERALAGLLRDRPEQQHRHLQRGRGRGGHRPRGAGLRRGQPACFSASRAAPIPGDRLPGDRLPGDRHGARR